MSNANPRPLTSMLTQGDLATRMAAFDFSVMGQLLPNPDPLLKELGRDISTYRDLLRRPHVGACVRRRKAAVLARQWGLTRGAAGARVQAALKDMMADWDMERIIRQALDACQFGYQPMELTWKASPSGLWLTDMQAKPPEWFCFDDNAELRFRTKAAPIFGEAVPPMKFVLPRQDASYQNPYGLPDLGLCYWPDLFMRGGMRFWLTFAEKYGGAFAAAKQPRGTPEPERQATLAALEDLLSNGVAVIPDDNSVELMEMAGKSASAELYERLVMFCRSEISIVQTGTNQTVEAEANKASAHAGLDVAAALCDADCEVAAAAINQALRWVVELRWPGSPAPVFELWDQRSKDELQAKRDAATHSAGARFTNAYFERAYGYQPGDLVEAAPSAAPGSKQPQAGPAFAEPQDGPSEPTAALQAQLDTAGEPLWQTWLAELQRLVAEADSAPALQEALLAHYAHLDPTALARLMGAAFALAELQGMDEAASEAARRA
jgi:hypothetical protein